MFSFSLIKDTLDLLIPTRCCICERVTAGAPVCSPCIPISATGPRCQRCHSPTTALIGDCPACHLFPLPMRCLRHLWDYDQQSADIIKAMKYGHRPEVARWSSKQLLEHTLNTVPLKDWDCLVPFPSPWRSNLWRGFNQCTVMALEIGRALYRPVLINVLKHRGYQMGSQASMQDDKRINNVRHAFQAKTKLLIGANVLLIEDVITSGASIAFATETLLNAGASSVDCLALAKAEIWHQRRSAVHSALKL